MTTQVEPALRDNAGLEKLAGAVRKNCEGSPGFSVSLEKLLAQKIFDPTTAGLAISGLSDEELFRFFGVALGKWLLQLVAGGIPPWSVRLLTSYRYTIKEGVAPMFSFAFLFQKAPAIPLQDKSGLSQAPFVPPPPFDEKKYALGLVSAVGKIRDVEHMFEADPELKRSMAESSAALLEAAGFDPVAYRDFLKIPEGT